MTDARERLRQPRLEDLREESALPLRADYDRPDTRDDRRMGFRVVGFSLLLTVGVSVALEFAGWRIALDAPSASASGINAAAFLRGALDTMLGAVGIGAIGALSTLTSPKTWRRPWRRLPVGFLGGSLAFLGFLSALTLSYFL